MADILLLTPRLDREGTKRLLAVLGEDFAAGKDLGPRGAQMRAIGLSLEHQCSELRRAIESLSIGASGGARSDISRWCDDILGVADAFARLGASVRHHPI